MTIHPPRLKRSPARASSSAATPSARWTDGFLDAKRRISDPYADTIVDRLFAENGVEGVSRLMRTLVANAEPPPEQLPETVRRYFEQTLSLPTWADMEQIRRAEAFFDIWGPEICMMLFCASLPTGYAMAHAVKILHLTARLQTDTRRRIIETAQFLIDVMAPGALAEGGHGLRVIQKVRLMHAAVRHLVRVAAVDDPNAWNADWGEPINQELLEGTVLEFSLVPLMGIRKLGGTISAEDAEAYLHAWKVIGHLFGVDDDLLPENMGDAYIQARVIQRRHIKRTPEGIAMTNALVGLVNDLTPGPILDGVIEAMIAHLVGQRTARVIGLRPSRAALVQFHLMRGLIWASYRLPVHRRVVRMMHPFSFWMLEHCPLVDRGGYRAPFQIPTRLATRWHLREPNIIKKERAAFDQVAKHLRSQAEPVPARPWSSAQTWEHLLFMHWRAPAEALQPFIPPGLELETYDGTAWLSLVAMRYGPAHFRHMPQALDLPLPESLRVINVPELNARTYVRAGGRSGVLFLNIDTGSQIVAEVARHMYGMPYVHSEVRMKSDGPWIDFTCRSVRDGLTLRLAGRYRGEAQAVSVDASPTDAFLHNRSLLFTVKSDGRLYSGEVHHKPWNLHAAEARIEQNDMGQPFGLDLTETAPLLRYVRESRVLVWSLDPVT